MRILAVDDDQVALDLLEACLREAGFPDLTMVTSARDAEAALDGAQRQFDCILLDIQMPEVSGIELCADIRRRPEYRHTPILMITAMKRLASIEQAFANGATDYITKPFEFVEVVARIKMAERLVNERQAALDSYAALRREPRTRSRSKPRSLVDGVNSFIDQGGFELSDNNLLPLSVFDNYLVRMTRADDCKVEVIGLKVDPIDRLFEELEAAEFVGFLGSFVDAVREYSGRSEVFLTHLGNGMFLCASDQVRYPEPEVVEQGIRRCLAPAWNKLDLPGDISLEVAAGTPLQLFTASKPNFNRVVKVATARLTTRIATKRERTAQPA